MTGALTILAVMLLTSPDVGVDKALTKAVSADADAMATAVESQMYVKRARISSVRSDFDREAGVVMFEGNVIIEYDRDYTMASDRLFVFTSGTNELSRVVAVGNVSITNDIRVGSCEMAVYQRKSGEISMYAGRNGSAKLADAGDAGNEVEGSRIRFWLDSEHIEVENPQIKVDRTGKDGLM